MAVIELVDRDEEARGKDSGPVRGEDEETLEGAMPLLGDLIGPASLGI